MLDTQSREGGQFAASPGISTGTLPCTLSLYSSLPAFVHLDNLSNVYSDNLSNMCIFSFCQVCIKTISLICEDNPEDDVKHCKEGREAFQEELVDSEDKKCFYNISCCFFYRKQTVNCFFLY